MKKSKAAILLEDLDDWQDNISDITDVDKKLEKALKKHFKGKVSFITSEELRDSELIDKISQRLKPAGKDDSGGVLSFGEFRGINVLTSTRLPVDALFALTKDIKKLDKELQR